VNGTYVPPGGPPQRGPSRELYGRMGRGNIFRMLEAVYAELEKSELRPMFPDDMKMASRRSALFFVGIMGGPPLYNELIGPPRMRQRHLPFRIDEHARQVWLGCFRKAMENAEAEFGFPPEHLPDFLAFLEAFSGWMVNTRGGPSDQPPSIQPESPSA